MGNIKSVNNRRNHYWLRNATISRINRLRHRDPKLWVFGCWEGSRYDDNAKYLFEYVCEKYPDIHAVWVTANKEVYSKLDNAGFHVVLIGSKESRNVQLNAGIAIYTNGIDDFGNDFFLNGAKIICLWHGMIIRKAYYNSFPNTGIHYQLKLLKDKLFNWTYFDYITSTSQYAAGNLCSTFNVGKEKVRITGQPRNDVLKMPVEKVAVLPSIEKANRYRYILYMPTHRFYEDTTIEETIRSFDNDKQLCDFLKGNNIKLLVKLHYLTKMEYKPHSDSILIVDNGKISATQELLAISELLITDYSSCVIDFAVKHLPTIVYAPDINAYIHQLGLLPPWDEKYSEIGICDYSVLSQTIIDSIQFPETVMTTTNIFNEFYEDDSIVDANYCENVFQMCSSIV